MQIDDVTVDVHDIGATREREGEDEEENLVKKIDVPSKMLPDAVQCIAITCSPRATRGPRWFLRPLPLGAAQGQEGLRFCTALHTSLLSPVLATDGVLADSLAGWLLDLPYSWG